MTSIRMSARSSHVKSTEIARPSSPTIIEVASSMVGYITDEKHPYYTRIELDARISSTTKFDRVLFSHLGFKSWRKGRSHIKHRGDRYTIIIPIDVACAATFEAGPFCICMENIGDSFTRVSVRMQHGMKRCKMTILQEEHQPKEPKQIDTFVKYEDIWYASVVTNGLQTVRIEEEVCS